MNCRDVSVGLYITKTYHVKCQVGWIITFDTREHYQKVNNVFLNDAMRIMEYL